MTRFTHADAVANRQKSNSKRLLLVGIIFGVAAFFLFFDFSDIQENVAKYLPFFNHTIERVVQTESEGVANASKTDQSEDIVITDKDVEQAYKKLLKERKKEVEGMKTLKADDDSYFRVKLASGKSILAVKIQSTEETVIITDTSGMILSLDKNEIADIEKEKK